ncbi:MAG: hypothetical protein JW839_19025 [Candidatus Lokiarchaeota archaeon]|nr:hypothetical protein [Candidatus Lokiarchaeota archaeon]
MTGNDRRGGGDEYLVHEQGDDIVFVLHVCDDGLLVGLLEELLEQGAADHVDGCKTAVHRNNLQREPGRRVVFKNYDAPRNCRNAAAMPRTSLPARRPKERSVDGSNLFLMTGSGWTVVY